MARAGGWRPGPRPGPGFFGGLGYPFRGLRFVYVLHPDLVRIWIFPVCITFGAFVASAWGAWTVHDDLVTWLWAEPSGQGWIAAVGRVIHAILELVVLLALVLGALVAVWLLSTVFAAPFNDVLSEEVERRSTGRTGPKLTFRGLMKDIVRTLGLELAKLSLYAVVMGPLWVVSWLAPGVGQAMYSAFGFFFTAGYFAVDYLDWPIARRNLGVGYRFRMLARRLRPMLGFGVGVWLLLFVPLLNLLFMPAAVAGGTLLYLELEPE